MQQSNDISYPPSSQQQTRHTLPQRANGADRRTEGRTPKRYTDPAAHANYRVVGVKFGSVHEYSVGRLVQLRDVTWKPQTAVLSVCSSVLSTCSSVISVRSSILSVCTSVLTSAAASPASAAASSHLQQRHQRLHPRPHICSSLLSVCSNILSVCSCVLGICNSVLSVCSVNTRKNGYVGYS